MSIKNHDTYSTKDQTTKDAGYSVAPWQQGIGGIATVHEWALRHFVVFSAPRFMFPAQCQPSGSSAEGMYFDRVMISMA